MCEAPSKFQTINQIARGLAALILLQKKVIRFVDGQENYLLKKRSYPAEY